MNAKIKSFDRNIYAVMNTKPWFWTCILKDCWAK